MKLFTALLFVAIGIFLAFRYPDLMFTVYQYLDLAWQWIVDQYHAIQRG